MFTSRRRVLVPAAALALGILITGCSSNQAGDAAVVGTQHITEQRLSDDVGAVLVAQGYVETKADAELVATTLNWLIVMNLLEQVAADNNLVVTKGDIDRKLDELVTSAGGRTELDAAYLKQFVAPGQVADRVRFTILAQKIADALAPGASSDNQTAALIGAVVAKSSEVSPDVSPRFGTWDSQNLQLGQVPTDLSAVLTTP